MANSPPPPHIPEYVYLVKSFVYAFTHLFSAFIAEHSHREIRVDSYDVTIFPAESIKNSVSKKAKMRSEAEEDDKYSAWFFDLAGEEQNRFTPLVKETISQM